MRHPKLHRYLGLPPSTGFNDLLASSAPETILTDSVVRTDTGLHLLTAQSTKGNPAPLLATRGIRLASPPRAIGQNGLKFALRDATTELEGVWWGVSHRASEWTAAQVVDVAYRLERDLWRDTSRLVARLADIRG
jgi:hypothetical protein